VTRDAKIYGMNDVVEPLGRAQTAITTSGSEARSSGSPVADSEPVGAPATTDAPVVRIGHYVIIERLGEGGMGVVYLARQEAPFVRDVALKLLKRGLDTARIVARFDAERRTLALMDHPHIARVLDAGASDDGRPWFVMELVRGERLTTWCDRERLDVRSRLRLFLDVCHAVRHAHQKGVMHRDLKPSNILVTEVDGRPAPKVIDFGIARAVDVSRSDAAFDTRAGQVLGTPEYMSPEQAGAIDGDIDTRTDVYSLGVVLFELLTGRRPFELASRRPADIVRALGSPAPRPSAVIGNEPATSEVCARRRTSPTRLRRLLDGDLGAVLQTALATDPAHRYGSVAQFAADLTRVLDGLPVEARRPTLVYRVRRFVARHRLAVGAAVLAGVLMVAAGVALARQRHVLAQERDRALEAERRSRAEAMTADRITSFLVSLFNEGDPESPGDSQVTARAVLDRGVARIPRELTDTPVMRARLLDTMGEVLRSLGRRDAAEPLLVEALELRRKHLAASDPQVAESLSRVGRARADKGRFDEALALYAEARRIVERANGTESAAYAEVLGNTGLVLMDAGRFEPAAEALSASVATLRRLPPTSKGELGPALHNLAVAEYELGRYDVAERLYREAAERLDARYGTTEPHPHTIIVRAGHGLVLRSLKRLSEARTVLERGVADARRLYTQPHPALATIVNNLALVAQDQGDFDAAERLFREILAIDRAVSGDESSDVAYDLHNLGWFLFSRRGLRDEGETMLRKAVALRRRLLGPTHPLTAQSMRAVGDAQFDRGRFAEAAGFYRDAVRLQKSALPRGHRQTIQSLDGLTRSLLSLRRFDEAEAAARDALTELAAAGPDAGARVPPMQALLDRVRASRQNGRLSSTATMSPRQ
jgi:serine/threonine protein kinase/tetratricopeptide (TPR) repeat protein